ncbi:MAG: Gfo/Idh/MocA family oxidoreductase [Phycisphaeraceae bacterium]|nr:MAG: Gfo/Idh/MocA family oxidoreductase [Phycisphaeraceae bacterium]
MTVGVAVIGLGFMGRTHVRAYRNAGSACRLVGVYDIDPSRLTGESGEAGNIATGSDEARLFDPDEVFATDSLDKLLASDEVDAVSVCTPTDTHCAVARAALRAGKHALVEKPVSLDRAELGALDEEATRAGRLCMPAMCMRFWPEWAWLAETLRRGDLGPARSLAFERVGAAPSWGGGFYQDAARCGGAFHDLHIHDTDFVCHLLGAPKAVTSVGDHGRVTTLYHFDGGPRHVVATGGWMRGGVGFRMRYIAEFERGTADFDLTREPTLCLARAEGGGPRPVGVGPGAGYDGEVRAFVDAIASGGSAPVTLRDAAETLAVLEAEARSMESGRREAIDI